MSGTGSDFTGGGHDDSYEYYDEASHSDGRNTSVGYQNQRPRTDAEARYPASPFGSSHDGYYQRDGADQSAVTEYPNDDAHSDQEGSYGPASYENIYRAEANRYYYPSHHPSLNSVLDNFEMNADYDAVWPKVWLSMKNDPRNNISASNLVDTGNKTGLHFISFGMLEKLGYIWSDLDSSHVRYIRRVKDPYQTLGSIDLGLSVQIGESYNPEHHCTRLHAVDDDLIGGYDLVFTEDPSIGLRTESQQVLLMLVLDKNAESEAERRQKQDSEFQRRKDKERESEKRSKREKGKQRDTETYTEVEAETNQEIETRIEEEKFGERDKPKHKDRGKEKCREKDKDKRDKHRGKEDRERDKKPERRRDKHKR